MVAFAAKYIPAERKVRGVGVSKIQRKCHCGGTCPACSAEAAEDTPFLQAKLKVSPPDDEYEREANQVADKVMGMSEPEEEEMLHTKPMVSQVTPLIQRQVEPEEVEEELQVKEMPGHSPTITPQTQAQIDALRGRGQPIAQSVRNIFEPRFGCRFSDVKLHTGSQADSLNRSLNARAFTIGRDIFFRNGEYKPGLSDGQQLLAHELTHAVQQTGPTISARATGQIQRKTCDPLANDCPSGEACFDTGATFQCLPTDEGAFTALVKKILKTKGRSITPSDEADLQALIDSDRNPDRLKRLEKIIVLWPSFGNLGKKARIIQMVTAPLRQTDLEESRRSRFSEEEGGEIKKALSEAVDERIEREKEKLLKKDKTLSESEAEEEAKLRELNSCLKFLEEASLSELYAGQEEASGAAQAEYKSGVVERKRLFKGKKPIHAATLSRLASELRLQGLVGPVHLLRWKGSHEKGHHEPSAVDLFDRLSSAGDGWYFFLVGLFSFHTFLIGVHVSSGGTKRRYFEIQGGQAVSKSRQGLTEWFDDTFDPTNFNPKHTRHVGSRVWQIYLSPTN